MITIESFGGADNERRKNMTFWFSLTGSAFTSR